MVEPDATAGAPPRPARRRHRGDPPLDLAGDLPGAARAGHAHRSTIVFVNSRRAAERLALRLNELRRATRSRAPPRLARARGAARRRGDAQGRRAAVPGRDLVARARHRHGRGRPRDPGRVAEVGRARAAADRPRRPRRRRRQPRPHLPEVPRRPARVRGRRPADARGRDRDDRGPAQPARRARAADRRDRGRRARGPAGARSTTSTRSSRGRTRTPSSAAPSSRTCSTCSTGATRQSEFAELRPRIVWDRIAGHDPRARGRAPAGGHQRRHDPRPRPLRRDAARTAAASASSTRRWSTRPARARRSCSAPSTWRIEEIGRDRVIVTPAPGLPGAVPFWKGDGVGRPKELGEAIGAFSRWAVDQPAEVLERDYDLDARAATQPARVPARAAARRRAWSRPTARSWSSASATRSATGGCACSRPFGGRVHAAWALALSARIRDQLGLESDAIWSDDGIIVHLPDAEEPPRRRAGHARARRGRGRWSSRELRRRALFGARFRENAARALLIPRARPGKRTPLWQQRLKSQSLLEVAKKYGEFPIMLETYRECLRDVFDVPGLVELLTALAPPRALAGRGRDRDRVAVRLLAAVRLRRDLHVRGRHAERRAARGGAVARPRPAARAARAGGAARPDRPGRARRRSRTTSSSGPRCGGRPAATACTTCCAGSGT